MVFNSSKSSAGLSNVKSQKVIEIEQIMYEKRDNNNNRQRLQESSQATQDTFISPNKMKQEFNQREVDRESIFNSIEELKKREQILQDSDIKEESSSNCDLSRDLQGSSFQFGSPPPKFVNPPMKIDEIIQNRKKISSAKTVKPTIKSKPLSK